MRIGGGDITTLAPLQTLSSPEVAPLDKHGASGIFTLQQDCGVKEVAICINTTGEGVLGPGFTGKDVCFKGDL